jgi:hypothetical protein
MDLQNSQDFSCVKLTFRNRQTITTSMARAGFLSINIIIDPYSVRNNKTFID